MNRVTWAPWRWSGFRRPISCTGPSSGVTGDLWCTTSLFAFPGGSPFDTASERRHRRVPAGADPALPLAAANRTAPMVERFSSRHRSCCAKISAARISSTSRPSGESLTMVDRDHDHGDDLDQQVTVSIFPRRSRPVRRHDRRSDQASWCHESLATLPVHHEHAVAP